MWDGEGDGEREREKMDERMSAQEAKLKVAEEDAWRLGQDA